MLFIKSKPEEILYHMNQLESLLLSKEELEKMNKFVFLNEFIENKSIQSILKEDIPDSKWIDETRKIIDLYSNRIERHNQLKNHVHECKNFVVYRYLEEKCVSANIEAFQQIGSWIFNEVDFKKSEKSRWISQKFMKNFEFSDVPQKLKNVMKDNWIEINLTWLHCNKDLFFSNKIFEN